MLLAFFYMLPSASCVEDTTANLFNEDFTPLMKSAKSCDIPELELLISNGAKINHKSRYGWSALMFAVSNGHEKCVRILLDAGADPNTASTKELPAPSTVAGHPPLTVLGEAAYSGHWSIAEILLEHGANIDIDAVALAGNADNIQFMEKLREKGASFNLPGNKDFAPSPLCVASKTGNIEILKWLLKNGVDTNLIVHRTSALGEAVKGNHTDVVYYLLNNGADPNLVYGKSTVNPEFYGTTAIYDAVFKAPDGDDLSCRNSLRNIKILLKKGADSNFIRPQDEFNILEKLEKRRTSNIKRLKDSNYDKDVRDRYQNSIKCDEAKIRLLKGSMVAH